MNRTRPWLPRWSQPIVALLLLAAPLVTAAPAAALTVDVSCLGTSSIDYSPGLLLAQQSVHLSEVDSFSPCTSTDPTLTSGIVSSDQTLPLSCLNPLSTGAGLFTINWNNRQSSTIDATFTVTATGSVITSTASGTIVAGTFTGSTATGVFTYVQPNLLQCLLPPGVTHQSGAITLLITH